jgi:hypothetical protein
LNPSSWLEVSWTHASGEGETVIFGAGCNVTRNPSSPEICVRLHIRPGKRSYLAPQWVRRLQIGFP